MSSDPSSAFAPSSPTSSATVIRSSSGPCASDSSSTSAIIAAIATPSSAPSVVPSALQPVAVADEHDPPFRRVVRARRVALAHHVEMTLQDQRRRRLTAGRRGYRDDEVSPGVLPHVEAVPGSPGTHVLDDGLLLSRGARDRRQRLEVPPKRTRLESRQCRFLRCHFRASSLPRACWRRKIQSDGRMRRTVAPLRRSQAVAMSCSMACGVDGYEFGSRCRIGAEVFVVGVSGRPRGAPRTTGDDPRCSTWFP